MLFLFISALSLMNSTFFFFFFLLTYLFIFKNTINPRPLYLTRLCWNFGRNRRWLWQIAKEDRRTSQVSFRHLESLAYSYHYNSEFISACFSSCNLGIRNPPPAAVFCRCSFSAPTPLSQWFQFPGSWMLREFLI